MPFLIEKGYLYAQNTGDYQESTDYKYSGIYRHVFVEVNSPFGRERNRLERHLRIALLSVSSFPSLSTVYVHVHARQYRAHIF